MCTFTISIIFSIYHKKNVLLTVKSEDFVTLMHTEQVLIITFKKHLLPPSYGANTK